MCVARKLNIQVSFDGPGMNHSVKWEREYMSISVTQVINIATSRLSVTGRNPWTKSPGTERKPEKIGFWINIFPALMKQIYHLLLCNLLGNKCI